MHSCHRTLPRGSQSVFGSRHARSAISVCATRKTIIPLERHIDYLTLHTGKKIEVPFETLLVFATNLDPAQIVDEAFMRRMGYRLRVDRPDRDMYGQIFRRYVESRGLKYNQGASGIRVGHFGQRLRQSLRMIRR